MAVYKRSYRPYAGPLTPPRWRFLVLTRYALADLFQSRIFTAMLVLTLVPVLVTAAVIYITNSETARTLLNLGGKPPFAVDNRFFAGVLQIQGWLAMVLTAWAGPTLVSADLSHGALPLFLSRPLTRAEYVLGKASVLALLLSCITWIPGLILFVLEAQLSPAPWFWSNLRIAGATVLGSWLWIALLALIALAVSAWVKWRVIAIAAMFMLLFIPAGFGQAINAIMRTSWGNLLNFPLMVTIVWHRLFGLPMEWLPTPARGFPVTASWFALLAIAMASLLLLNRRLKAREVVRG